MESDCVCDITLKLYSDDYKSRVTMEDYITSCTAVNGEVCTSDL